MVIHHQIRKPRGNEGVVGYSFVVADLLHVGHLHHFRECKKHCDFLIVGVYTDDLAASYKRKPIIPFDQRIKLVAALKPVDMVVPVEDKDATPMLKKFTEAGWKISFLFHGNDWKQVKGQKFIENIGGKLVQPKYYEGVSSTSIIREVVRRYGKSR